MSSDVLSTFSFSNSWQEMDIGAHKKPWSPASKIDTQQKSQAAHIYLSAVAEAAVWPQWYFGVCFAAVLLVFLDPKVNDSCRSGHQGLVG